MTSINDIVEKFNANKNQICENILFSLAPLLALVVARYGYKTWIKFEMLFELIVGSSLIIRPELFLSYTLNSPINQQHKFVCALTGVYLIWTVIGSFLLRNSTDQGVFYGRYWSRIILQTLTMVENLMSYKEGIHWNYKLLCLGTSFVIVDILINAYFLLKSRKPSGILEDRVNHVAKLDFFLLFVSGVFMYAFPDHLPFGIKSPNESYRSIIRSGGAALIGTSFESFFVSNFIYLNNKKTFMFARVLSCLLELIIIVCGFYCYKVLNISSLLTFISFNISYLLLVLYGYLITSSHEKTN